MTFSSSSSYLQISTKIMTFFLRHFFLFSPREILFWNCTSFSSPSSTSTSISSFFFCPCCCCCPPFFFLAMIVPWREVGLDKNEKEKKKFGMESCPRGQNRYFASFFIFSFFHFYYFRVRVQLSQPRSCAFWVFSVGHNLKNPPGGSGFM